MKDYDIAGAIAQYPGPYLAVAGDQDFSAAYVPGLVERAPAHPGKRGSSPAVTTSTRC